MSPFHLSKKERERLIVSFSCMDGEINVKFISDFDNNCILLPPKTNKYGGYESKETNKQKYEFNKNKRKISKVTPGKYM